MIKRPLMIVFSTILCMFMISCGGSSGGGGGDDGDPPPPPPGTVDILITSPESGAVNVGGDTKINILFSEQMASSSLSVNTANAVCSGSIQLSSDNFINCIQMASGSTSDNLKLYSVTPSVGLTDGTNYKIKVTTSAKGSSGSVLSSTYISAAAFGVGSGAVSQPVYVQAGFNPAEGDENIGKNTPITVAFDDVMNPDTVLANTADTNCSGSIQVSNDGFVTCIQMKAGVTTDNYRSFKVFPASDLANDTYQTRVTTAAYSLNGLQLQAQYTQGVAFTIASGYTVVLLNWQASKEKAVNFTGGGYRVYSSTSSFSTIGGASLIGTVSNNGGITPSSTSVSLSDGQTHYFRVLGFSSLKSGGSELSDLISLTLP